jgi:hypothetical protein
MKTKVCILIKISKNIHSESKKLRQRFFPFYGGMPIASPRKTDLKKAYPRAFARSREGRSRPSPVPHKKTQKGKTYGAMRKATPYPHLIIIS